jgi:prephenate dehydrogenase
MIQSIGLIGYGHFGAFLQVLAERYIPDAELKIFSRRRTPDEELFFPLEAVAACDAVILAVPIGEYGDYLDRIDPFLRADSVIVDVATVKKYTGDLLRAAAKGRPFIALHPMFGPESYAKRDGDLSGFRIVVTESTLEAERYQKLLRQLRSIGFSVVEKSADAHDRDLAETLFLTHYIGQVVAQGGFERTDIDTVSFGYLMDAVDSVRHDRRLFDDVFKFNPYCRQVIERFDKSERKVLESLLGKSSPHKGGT